MEPQKELEQPKPNLVYEDKQTGQILYGFSHVHLERLNKLLLILLVMLGIALLMFGFILWKVNAYHIVGKYIARCVC